MAVVSSMTHTSLVTLAASCVAAQRVLQANMLMPPAVPRALTVLWASTMRTPALRRHLHAWTVLWASTMQTPALQQHQLAWSVSQDTPLSLQDPRSAMCALLAMLDRMYRWG